MTTRRWWRVPAAVAVLALTFLLVACQAAPAAAPAQEAAGTEATAALFLMVDMVQGSKNIPADQKAAKSCVLNSRFPRNSEVVWRARVFDARTGKQLGGDGLSKVEVRLANGETIEMRFGPHPKDPPGEEYWTASWVVPKDHATGTLNYSVVATSTDGRTGEFKPFAVPPSLLTITDEVLPDAKEG